MTKLNAKDVAVFLQEESKVSISSSILQCCHINIYIISWKKYFKKSFKKIYFLHGSTTILYLILLGFFLYIYRSTKMILIGQLLSLNSSSLLKLISKKSFNDLIPLPKQIDRDWRKNLTILFYLLTETRDWVRFKSVWIGKHRKNATGRR